MDTRKPRPRFVTLEVGAELRVVRVINTGARAGCPPRREASCNRTSPQLLSRPASDDEVEGGVLAGARVADVHQKLGGEDRVLLVAGLTWKVELSRQQRAARRAHLEVEVPRSPGVQAGHDRPERVRALVVREEVTAQPVAVVVVFTVGAGV